MFIFIFFQVSFHKTNQSDLGVYIPMLKKKNQCECVYICFFRQSTAHGDTSGKYLEAEVVVGG